MTLSGSKIAGYEWDVTAFVRGEKAAGRNLVTVALHSGTVSSLMTEGDSREAAAGTPELIVYPGAPPVVLNPVADAYVRDGSYATSNYGGSAVLDVRTYTTAGNNRDAYLKFDVGAVSSPVVNATLRFNAALTGSGSLATSVYSVSDSTWTETGITWNNKPVFGSVLATTTLVGTANAGTA